MHDLRAGCDIIVSTPGRLIDLIRRKRVSCWLVTFLVLDEADKMFQMGFEHQVRAIVSQLRPDRQTLLFSATFKARVETLARDILVKPVRIAVDTAGVANEDVKQQLLVLNSQREKLWWLEDKLPGLLQLGSALIFVASRGTCDELARALRERGFQAVALHGDLAANERSSTMKQFKRGNERLVVATDVAARGLDVQHIKTVVCYDAARDMDTHTHRVGRTGRAGAVDGVAFTMLSPGRDTRFATELAKLFEKQSKPVPNELWQAGAQQPHERRQPKGDRGPRGKRPPPRR